MRKLLAILLCVSLLALAAGAAAETFTGTVKSNIGAGDVSVTIDVEDGKVTVIDVTGETETPGIGLPPIEDGTYAAMLTEDYASDDGIIDNISSATMTTAAVQAAFDKALEAAGLKEAKTVDLSDAECDVVIIGAGGAGMSAALAAVDAGAGSVILLEKTGATGGNSSRATGGMNAAKTPWQDLNAWADSTTTAVKNTIEGAKKNYPGLSELTGTVEAQFEAYLANPEGYFDSVELFELDTMVGGKGINDPALVHTLAANSADAIAWLETKNAVLHDVGSFGGASVKRIHRAVTAEGKTTPVGAYLVARLTEDIAAEDKVDLRLNSRASALVLGDDGKVTGVTVETEDGSYTVSAKAVVLATGGFGYDLDRVASYRPDLAGFVTTNAAGATGDGLDMAVAIGAATVDLDQIQIHPSVYTPSSALITEGIRGDGAILVNQKGERFVNELLTRDAVSAAELAQEGGYAYTIVDQKMMDASATYNGYFTKGYAIQADTVEALAEAAGMDPAVFAATMEAWNAACAAQTDEAFGRTSFAAPLDTAPFYAIQVSPGIHHCMGGVKINTNAEVLNGDGAAIPGLFAAGEVTGGVHGANRLGGNAVADIVVFGRIAGENAAALAK